MKYLITMVAVVAALISCSTSRVQTEPIYTYHRDMQSFYYYPSANVYYDGSCNRYIYNHGGSWITTSILPVGVYIGNSPRYQVYYRGAEIWRDNQLHRNTYFRQPEVVYDRHNDNRRDWKGDRRHRGRD